MKGNLVVYNPETGNRKFTAEVIDEPELKARINFIDGRTYEGQFDSRTFLPEGKGRMDYNDGKSYEGEWKMEISMVMANSAGLTGLSTTVSMLTG